MDDRKVVLGLSDGVDSAVAARILTDMGYEVHGLYLKISGENFNQSFFFCHIHILSPITKGVCRYSQYNEPFQNVLRGVKSLLSEVPL